MDPKQIQIKILSAFFQTLGIHICSSGKSLNTKSVAGSFPALFGEQREQNVAAQRSHWERFAWSDKANPFAGFIYQQQELLVEPKQLNLNVCACPTKRSRLAEIYMVHGVLTLHTACFGCYQILPY